MIEWNKSYCNQIDNLTNHGSGDHDNTNQLNL